MRARRPWPPHVDAAVRCPEVAKEQGNLPIAKSKRCRRDPLLVRTLPEDPDLPKPGVQAGRTPTVAVSGEQQLVPLPPSRIACDGQAKLRFRCARDQGAVLLREECDAVVWPGLDGGGLGKTAGDRDPVAGLQILDPAPAVRPHQSVASAGSDLAAAGHADPEYWAPPHRPDEVAASGHDAAVG